VRDLNITVEKGTIFGILGPNGAGKTTTLSMLCGILLPTGGVIEAAGMKRQEIRRQLGYVPQELALYERLTARDNLAFFGKLYGLGGRRLGRRIDALLDMTGLASRADEPVAGFSQGMKRRLNLAAGLVHEPTVILMDEPTVGIDPQSRNRIHDAIFTLRRRGATILYTTHYMEEATKLCDRIAIMDHGSVVLCDTPKAAVAKYGCFRMELTFSGDGAGRLLRALRTLPAVESADAADGRLHLVASGRVRSTETILAVERTARALGEEVSLSRLSEPNLETLFLDITGRSLRDEEGR
jgi:ABC-2 type transport system ATP-binding protein